MATAVASKPTARKVAAFHVRLVEEFASSPGLGKVDKGLGILYGAKIVGFESRNIGRTIGLDPHVFGEAVDKTYGYSKRALETAIPMYEGAVIRIDHPQSELDSQGRRRILQRSRPAMSTTGVVKNVRLGEDGLYGDIHLFLHHPSTAFILEVAEREPSKLALSHNADGTPVLKDGRAVIDRINQVYSVDIVGDRPGTTNGLFEDFAEHSEMPMKIKELIESLPANAIGRTFLLEMAPEMYSGAKVAEMDMMPKMGGAAMNPTPQSQVGDALRTVVMAIYDDPATDAMGKLAKLKEIFKLKAKLDGNNGQPILGGEGGSDESPEDDAGDGEKKPFGGKESGDGSSKSKPTEESDAGGESGDDDESNLEESMAADIKKNPEFVALLESVNTLKTQTAALVTENASLKAVENARALLESMEREPTDVRIKAVTAMADDAGKKALIETWEKKGEKHIGEKPVLQLMESNAGEQSDNAESFARRIRSSYAA